MKTVTFGNIIEQEKVFKNSLTSDGEIFNDKRFQSNGMEFFNQDDKISARDFNRPIRQLFEDSESSYEIIQTLSKILLGEQKTGIIPNILEEFNPDNVQIGYYFDKSKPFLRIPTGALFINLRSRDENTEYNGSGYEYDSTTGKEQEFVKKYNDGEEHDYDLENYVIRDHNAAIIVNRPKIEFYERELAEHFNFDLNEQGNNINVKYEIEDGKIKYTCNVTKTKYNYNSNEIVEENFDIYQINGKDENGNSIVKTEFENVFDLTSSTFNKISSFVNKDGYYSLEETIPLFNTDTGELLNAGEYIVFYRVGKYDDDEYRQYSLSGNYGLIVSNQPLRKDEVALFKLTITARSEDTKEVRIATDIDGKKLITSYLKFVDRSCITTKNIDIKNNYVTVDGTQWYLCNADVLSNMVKYNMKD